MKKNTLVKVLSVVLSLVAVFCMAIPSFAADITTNGGNGATPVNLSSTDDGTLGGDPAATALSVTLPTAFPLAMGTDGTVTTADNCKIVNNSYGAVRVKSATINGANGWSLTAFGDKSILASAKVDSDMLGFELALNNGTAYKTDSSNETTQKFFSTATADGKMSGVGDTAHNSIPVNYNAIVTPLSEAVTAKTVANVVFIVEWDTAA